MNCSPPVWYKTGLKQGKSTQ
jgi:hypothetical protein